jgi:hypothetical protein
MKPPARAVLIVGGLFLVALVARAVVALAVPFPASEDSAYYVGVARNLLQGHGLVSNAMWSYATPPLVLPKPAFELWMPMATFVVAIPMALFGTTFGAAQVGSVFLGAVAAPMTWLIARDAAAATDIGPRRTSAIAIGSGLLVAVLGPLLLLGSFAFRYGLGLDTPWYLAELVATGYVKLAAVAIAVAWLGAAGQMTALAVGRYAPYPSARERPPRGPLREAVRRTVLTVRGARRTRPGSERKALEG